MKDEEVPQSALLLHERIFSARAAVDRSSRVAQTITCHRVDTKNEFHSLDKQFNVKPVEAA